VFGDRWDGVCPAAGHAAGHGSAGTAERLLVRGKGRAVEWLGLSAGVISSFSLGE